MKLPSLAAAGIVAVIHGFPDGESMDDESMIVRARA
jgi:hypothetical protein